MFSHFQSSESSSSFEFIALVPWPHPKPSGRLMRSQGVLGRLSSVKKKNPLQSVGPSTVRTPPWETWRVHKDKADCLKFRGNQNLLIGLFLLKWNCYFLFLLLLYFDTFLPHYCHLLVRGQPFNRLVMQPAFMFKTFKEKKSLIKHQHWLK